MQQTTIRYPASCYGIGVHSGQKVQVTLKPAKQDQGIVFIRTDIKASDNYVRAAYNSVVDTNLCTTLANPGNKFSVSTIEHLMAAIWGCGIDNLIVEIDGPEVPIMDGSSQPFVFMIECAQKTLLLNTKKQIKINREVFVEGAGGATNLVSPADYFSIALEIDFDSKLIQKQSIEYHNKELFNSQVASARTFGFLADLEYLQGIGLAKGASLDNSIGLDKDNILNHDGLRFQDEFVRHKLLDALGDFYLANCEIIGSFSCIKPGHHLNNLLIRKIFENPNNYSVI